MLAVTEAELASESLYLVWDSPDHVSTSVGIVCHWSGYLGGNQSISVPDYVEEHAERLRERYVAFIAEIGDTHISGRRVADHLRSVEGASLWGMSLLVEKSPFKSPIIYDCVRMLALEEILRDGRPATLRLVSEDRGLAESMKALCRNLGISFQFQPIRRGRPAWRRALLHGSGRRWNSPFPKR